MPVSRTSIRIGRPSPARRSSFRVTPPCLVNLKALESRLRKIWSILSASLTKPPRIWSSMAKVSPRSVAACSNRSRQLSASAALSMSDQRTSMRPASTLDRSRTSLIRRSKSSPERWMISACRISSTPRCPLSLPAIILDSRMIALSGVRSSWDMLARNSDLYWPESSSWRALASSSSRDWRSSRLFCWSSCCCSSIWALVCSSSSLCCCNCCCCSSSWALVWRSSSVCCCNCCCCSSMRALASCKRALRSRASFSAASATTSSLRTCSCCSAAYRKAAIISVAPSRNSSFSASNRSNPASSTTPSKAPSRSSG